MNYKKFKRANVLQILIILSVFYVVFFYAALNVN